MRVTPIALALSVTSTVLRPHYRISAGSIPKGSFSPPQSSDCFPFNPKLRNNRLSMSSVSPQIGCVRQLTSSLIIQFFRGAQEIVQSMNHSVFCVYFVIFLLHSIFACKCMPTTKGFLLKFVSCFLAERSPDESVRQVLAYWFGDTFFLDDRSGMETKEYFWANSKKWFGGASNDKEVCGGAKGERQPYFRCADNIFACLSSYHFSSTSTAVFCVSLPFH
jgi:hypothetical protein